MSKAEDGARVGAAVKRCLIYARVSTEDQARHGFSLAAQVRECRARAEALGYAADQIEELVDEGYSGDAVNRPGLNRVRDLVATPGKVGHVVMLDPDRFARSLSLQLVVTEEIQRGGAALEFLNFDWQDTPEGKLFYSMRGAIAEYEKASIRERTRRGREQKARQGLLPVGKSFYGYRFEPISDQLIAVPAEQAVLLLIRSLMLDGAPGGGDPLSAVQVARWLADRGIPAPKGDRWYASTVARIARNGSYTGAYQVLGGAYTIPIAPLWDEPTHQSLCARLAANRFPPRRNPLGGYMMSGLLRCGVCGRRMRGHAVKDRRRDYRYYICVPSAAFPVSGGTPNRCERRHWPALDVDSAAWQVVLRTLAAAKPNLDRSPVPAVDAATLERVALQRALDRREAEVARYWRLFAHGHIVDEGQLRQLVEPAQQKAGLLRERLRRWADDVPIPGTPVAPDPNRIPLTTRRKLLQTLIRSATVSGNTLTIEAHLAPRCHAIPSAD